MSVSVFLGFDLSTQSHSVVVVDENLAILKEESVNFDLELSHYKTQGGAIRHSDGATVTSPVLMWVESLDLLLEKLQKSGFAFGEVKAISFSGQQHGSVYWKNGARKTLDSLASSDSLLSQLKDSFSVDQSPIWMDSSTTQVCREIEELLGGAQVVADQTGSRCFERFTVNQIAKIAQETPDKITNTERIGLVSSFLASLFLEGKYADIDPGDGSGMNVMNIRSKEWIDSILQFVSPSDSLSAKLGHITPSHQFLGQISSYFTKRYGFSSDCCVIAASGDNPCTLAGLKLREGDLAVSLGTSDTIFGPLRNAHPSVNEGNIMCNPVVPDGFMGMICRKNGSLTREHVRNEHATKDWSKFSELLKQTQPGNDGYVGIYFLETEIAPCIKGFFYKNLSDFNALDWTPSRHVRAIVESQFLQMFIYSQSLGFEIKGTILATGGASRNHDILQILADIFGVPVCLSESSKAACVGAAYRAVHGYQCHKQGKFIPFESVVGPPSFQTQINPDMKANFIYQKMIEPFKRFLIETEKQSYP